MGVLSDEKTGLFVTICLVAASCHCLEENIFYYIYNLYDTYLQSVQGNLSVQAL
jgi:hypothetical protein